MTRRTPLLRSLVLGSLLLTSGSAAAEEAPAFDQRGALALGADMGVWGSGFAQAVRFDVAVFEHLVLRLRGVSALGAATNPEFDPVLLGGLQLFGRSSVVSDSFRVYGGGGVLAGARPSRPSGDTTRAGGVTGGGFVGIEFLVSTHFSASLEVGGQGSVHPRHIDAGPSVMAGFLIYP